MKPLSHIILGAIFALALYFLFPNLGVLAVSIIFLASFLIDFDHYLEFVLEKKSLNLKKAYFFQIERGKKDLRDLKKRKKLPKHMYFMHTLEFHLLLLLLSYFHIYFFLIFIGFLFHSIVDAIFKWNRGTLKLREYSLIKYLIKNDQKK